MLGKGGRIRSVPMPVFAKTALDAWLQAANLTSGRVFRAVNKGGKISEKGIGGQAVFEIVKEYSTQSGLTGITPHHLRRTFSRLAHNGKSSLEQIQLSLGHCQIATTTAYVEGSSRISTMRLAITWASGCRVQHSFQAAMAVQVEYSHPGGAGSTSDADLGSGCVPS